jgi:hypothetical protein
VIATPPSGSSSGTADQADDDFIGEQVHFVDPDGAIGFALAMDAQETHIAQVQIAGALLREGEGALLGAAASAEPTGAAYSVAYETKLAEADLGRSRTVHINRSNAAFDADLKSDPAFAKAMDELIPGVSDSVSSVGGRKTPPGWIWHHAKDEGIMQLVQEAQHTVGSVVWRIMHPGGKGGHSLWAIPRGAPKN